MSYFIALLAILTAVFSFAYLTKQKFELIFPAVNLSVIVFLYFFGFFGKLVLGSYLLLLVAALSLGLALLRARKEGRGAFLRSTFSPFAVIVLVFAVFQYPALFLCEVVGWDELTHWGLVVKNMYFTGDFGRGAGTTTMFHGYPPAMSLYLYFFQVFGKSFSPAHVYMAINLINVSLLLPVVSRFRRLSKKILAAVVILSTAFVFNITMYISIWSDPFLAILFGYIMINYLCFRREVLPKTNAIGILLASFVLTAVKSTGIAFLLFAYLVILADLLLIRHENGKRTRLPIFLYVGAVAVPLLSKFSWSFYISQYHLGEAWNTNRLTLSGVMRFLGSADEFQVTVTKNFFRQLLFPFSYSGNGNATPIPYPLILLSFGVLIFLIAKRMANRRYMLSLSLGIYVTFFIYLISMLISYLFTFSAGEALGAVSFVRYLNTFVLGAMLALVSLLLCTVKEQETAKNGSERRVLMAASAFLIVVCGIASPIIGSVMKTIKEPYRYFTEAVSTFGDQDSVYVITAESDGFLESPVEYQYLFFRFYATPHECSGLKIGGSPYIGDPWKVTHTVEQTLADFEAGGYRYMYLHYIDDAFQETYAEIFEDVPQEFTFYQKGEDGVFKKVSFGTD